MEKKIKKLMSLSAHEVAELQKIADKLGQNWSWALHSAISDFILSTKKAAYVQALEDRNAIAAARLEAEKNGKVPPTKKEINAEWAGKSLCERLEGTVVEDGGILYCEFTEYNNTRRPPNHAVVTRVALEDLDERTVQKQYDPSKEKVLEWHKWLQENAKEQWQEWVEDNKK